MRLSDNYQALFVMPGCKLEVWDHGSGLEVTIILTSLSTISNNHDNHHIMIMIIMVMMIIIKITFNGVKDAIKEERKGFNQGDYKNMKDL